LTQVSNAASLDAGVSPGSIASVFGYGLLLNPGSASAASIPLPTTLMGATVSVNGTPAPLFAAVNQNGFESLSFQAPYSLSGGAAEILVSNASNTLRAQANIVAAQPGLFTADGTHAAALHADFGALNVSRPAEKGEVVLLYGTGLGPVDNQPETGRAAQASPLSRTTTTPTVTIGGRNAEVLFSGLAPGMAGLYQLNVRVPADAPSGDQDVVVSIGGQASRPVKVPVR
jgi:uncharacterized protein (TIGR03437 family)